MPFFPPFRTQFNRGDLIYGLTNIRYKYLNKEPFETARICNINNSYPPVVIDKYLTPIDRIYMQEKMDEYDRRTQQNDWDGYDKEEFKKQVNYFDFSFKYADKNNKNYSMYENDFFGFIENHNKYKTALNEELEYDKNTMGRKCKGGLLWVTLSGNQLTNSMHIHFILDDINMDTVVNKRDDNITGKELRWLYRNRKSPYVATKVQFWCADNPTLPPWETEEAIWENYIPGEGYSGTFSQLFNI
ncbi:hypothetical protein [Xenorhabdus bharatensis]|uniref:hypothetical protein n=1 Tax=Xenorhabdus bharatensis TaxID=3136256 RepID=UPI0030F468EE